MLVLRAVVNFKILFKLLFLQQQSNKINLLLETRGVNYSNIKIRETFENLDFKFKFTVIDNKNLNLEVYYKKSSFYSNSLKNVDSKVNR